MSRNSAETTFFCLHACHMVFSRRCSESLVDHPGLPPKWVLGRRLWVLSIKEVLSAIMADSSFAVVFSRAMGQYAFDCE